MLKYAVGLGPTEGPDSPIPPSGHYWGSFERRSTFRPILESRRMEQRNWAYLTGLLTAPFFHRYLSHVSSCTFIIMMQVKPSNPARQSQPTVDTAGAGAG